MHLHRVVSGDGLGLDSRERPPLAGVMTGEYPVTPDDRNSELSASFSETAQALFSAGNPADTLRAVGRPGGGNHRRL
jgi:hypothetical protein